MELAVNIPVGNKNEKKVDVPFLATAFDKWRRNIIRYDLDLSGQVKTWPVFCPEHCGFDDNPGKEIHANKADKVGNHCHDLKHAFDVNMDKLREAVDENDDSLEDYEVERCVGDLNLIHPSEPISSNNCDTSQSQDDSSDGECYYVTDSEKQEDMAEDSPGEDGTFYYTNTPDSSTLPANPAIKVLPAKDGADGACCYQNKPDVQTSPVREVLPAKDGAYYHPNVDQKMTKSLPGQDGDTFYNSYSCELSTIEETNSLLEENGKENNWEYSQNVKEEEIIGKWPAGAAASVMVTESTLTKIKEEKGKEEEMAKIWESDDDLPDENPVKRSRSLRRKLSGIGSSMKKIFNKSK